ncbi:FadR family transcriptional regulator [Thermoactinomyces vulgaris]|uniref:FadR/GntR family transcriptional regulator n=1 Tax=Thermoactinomyces vulgaris TaxID=2026 RepID=UPI0009FEBF64|nr:FadR/GntR family transcriptional regulator [Thermoactinomyces vulgaris]QBK13245.1 FadR family transcriptional regulator [Thermoactinomyces vulgaris]
MEKKMKMRSALKVRKSYEEVADLLKEHILNGTYQPGERLPSFRELSEQMGVGQSTIREAVSSLKTIGLVSIRHGEGTFVTRLDPKKVLSEFKPFQPVTRQDLLSLLEARKVIETGMARYASERRSGEDLKQMEKALFDMKNAAAKGELGDEADLAFHYAIARASHNPVLEWMMESIYGILSRSLKESRQQLFLIPGYPDQLLQEHQKICEAIAAQHAGEAENAMFMHLAGVEEKLFANREKQKNIR